MAVCRKIRAVKRQICIGDLRKKININTRAIVPPVDGDFTQHGQNYTIRSSPHAMVKTLNGIDTFDGVEISGVDAIAVWIRFDATVTGEDFVRFGTKNYSVRSAENLDQRGEFTKLICIFEGDQSKAGAT